MNEIFIVVDAELTVGYKSEEKVVNETVTAEEASDNNIFGEQASNLASVITSGEKASENMTPPTKKKKNEVLYANNPILDASNPVTNVEDMQPTTPRPLPPFPRLDPRVNYPVFPPRPPTCGFEETTPRTLITQPYPYQNLAHQTSSYAVHPYIQFQKMSAASNFYPHLQNYPPVPPPYYPPWCHSSEANPNNMAPNQTVRLPFIRPSPIPKAAPQIQANQTGSVHFNESEFKKFFGQTEAPTSPTVNKYHKSFASSFAPTINSAPAAPGSNSTGNKISSGLKTDNMHTDGKIAQSVITPVAPDGNKKSDSVVQILPQALVDGAINVASTAYSTAWNALNNLRTTEDKEGVSNKIKRYLVY